MRRVSTAQPDNSQRRGHDDIAASRTMNEVARSGQVMLDAALCSLVGSSARCSRGSMMRLGGIAPAGTFRRVPYYRIAIEPKDVVSW